jgi:hypothetical protein
MLDLNMLKVGDKVAIDTRAMGLLRYRFVIVKSVTKIRVIVTLMDGTSAQFSRITKCRVACPDWDSHHRLIDADDARDAITTERLRRSYKASRSAATVLAAQVQS